jgi:hypothetical protein
MRLIAFVPAVCCALLVTSCSESGPVQPSESANRPMTFESGRIAVYVHWGGQGVPDKRVELLGLHLEGKTDAGGMAEFIAPVGDYTVRVYDINRGGPSLWYFDTKVTVMPDQEVTVDVVDCLPCD